MHLSRMGLVAVLVGASASAAIAEPGTVDARCGSAETGPAIVVDVQGLKDRSGQLRLELYPPDEDDYLAADTKLLAAGKTFRRILAPLPVSGPVELCIRVPQAGRYALVLIHNRDGKRSFSIWHDGVGVPSNPAALHGSPPLADALIDVGPRVKRIVIVMDYMRGWFSFGRL